MTSYTHTMWFVSWGTWTNDDLLAFGVRGSGNIVDAWFYNDFDAPDVAGIFDGSYHHFRTTYDGTVRKIYVDNRLSDWIDEWYTTRVRVYCYNHILHWRPK